MSSRVCRAFVVSGYALLHTSVSSNRLPVLLKNYEVVSVNDLSTDRVAVVTSSVEQFGRVEACDALGHKRSGTITHFDGISPVELAIDAGKTDRKKRSAARAYCPYRTFIYANGAYGG